MAKHLAVPDQNKCVACGECAHICPRGAVSVLNGCYAVVDEEKCVGCRLCEKNCPADCIRILNSEDRKHEEKTLV